MVRPNFCEHFYLRPAIPANAHRGCWNTGERGKEVADRLTVQSAFFHSEKPVDGVVRELHGPICVNGKDRGRTEGDQKIQLLFRFPAKRGKIF